MGLGYKHNVSNKEVLVANSLCLLSYNKFDLIEFRYGATYINVKTLQQLILKIADWQINQIGEKQ